MKNHGFDPEYQHAHLLHVFIALILFAFPCLAYAEDEPGLGSVDARLSELREAGEPPDSELFTSYREAKQLLLEAELHDGASADDIAAIKSSPELEKGIQKRIETLDSSHIDERDFALSKEQLEARLNTARSEKADAKTSLDSYNRRLAARESNADQYRKRLAAIRSELEALTASDYTVNKASAPSLAEAKAWRDKAAERALNAERRAMIARLDSQPARYSVLAALRTEAELRLDRASEMVSELEQRLHRSQLEALSADHYGIHSSSTVIGMANDLLDNVRALNSEHLEVREDVISIRAKVDDLERRNREIERRYSTAQRAVDYAGESETLGKFLLTYWEELGNFKNAESAIDPSRRAARAIVRRVRLEDDLRTLANPAGYLSEQLEQNGIDRDALGPGEFSSLLEIVRSYNRQIRANISQQSSYIDALDALRERQNALQQLTARYESFLKGRILWIPAYPALWETSLSGLTKEVKEVRAYAGGVRVAPTVPLLLGLILFLLLHFRRRYFAGQQRKLDELIIRPREDSIRHTLLSLFYLLLRAVPVPGALACIGLAIDPVRLSQLLIDIALGLLILQSYRIICEHDGLGMRHFSWSPAWCNRVHHNLSLLVWLWLPLVGLTGVVFQATAEGDEALILRILVVILFVLPCVQIARNLLYAANESSKALLVQRGVQFQLLLVLVSAGIVVAVIQGHMYSVAVVFRSLMDTFFLIIVLVVLHAFFMRWISVARRRLRMKQLISSMGKEKRTSEVIAGEDVVSVGNVSEDTAEFVNAGFLILAVFALYQVWSPLLPAFEVLKETVLWTSTSRVDGEVVENNVSLGMLLIVAVMAGFTIYLARKMPAFIDLVLRSKTEMSTSARYTVSVLTNYTIVGVGLIAALSALGVNWAQLQWLVAALGVGIGFGLQEIVANFISGLIILFERPIRIGDIVTTGDKDGVVTRIRIRATTIRDWDGKELLVPNKEFITGRLLNWSLSDPKVRIIVPVGVAYGSNLELALRVLREIVDDHPRIVDDPEPQIVFESFGDNALILSARVYLSSSENRAIVITELNSEIYRRFGEHDIRIAFPQRDLHLDSESPLRVVFEQASEGKSEN